MYPGADRYPALMALAESQQGVLRRDQLVHVGLGPRYAARQVAAARWSEWGNNVVLLSNAEPTREQFKRIALLDPSGPTALASHTALEQAGFHTFAKEADEIHVLVVHGATYCQVAHVIYHESRRFYTDDVHTTRGLHVTLPARSGALSRLSAKCVTGRI